MRSAFLPFHVPQIGEEEIEAVVRTMRSGWLTTGPRAHEFEERFAEFIGAPHVHAVNSGTAGLHLALEAIGLQEGDEVLVPTMTFAASAEVVRYLRAKPVLVECRPDTLNIDPDLAERAITSRTKAIVPVHVAGQPCEMDRILEIAGRHDLKVIEDAAHALPARYRGKRIGTVGDITCFSFYATKTLTTGEGGMVASANEDYAERMRIMSQHGISRDAWNRDATERSWHYDIVHSGFKYNMSDIAAAMGLEQLKKCARFGEVRRGHAELYTAGFADVPEITTPYVSPDVEHAWHLYLIQIELERLRIGRDEFVALLRDQNVGCSVHFIPLHLHPYYRDTCGYRPADFPNAWRACQRLISLPIYPAMSEQDVQDVIDAVTHIVEGHRR